MSESAEWRKGTLSDLAHINPVSVSALTAPGWRFRYIDLSSVDHGQIDWANLSELIFAHAPSRARRPVEAKDVLFGTVRPALQSHGFIPASPPMPLVASTGFAVLRARAIADPHYLFQLIMSRNVLSEALRFQVGSNYPAVNESDVRQFTVPIPPLAEQQRIAEILQAVGRVVQATERLIAKLTQIKQGLLHDLLTRGIDKSGRLRNPNKGVLDFVPDDSGFKPSIWRQLSFGELATYVNGNSFDVESWTDTGYPIIRIQNLNGSGNFNYYNGPVAPDWLVQPGDLLFAWSGTRESSFGPTIWPGPQGVLNQHIFKVYENKSIVSRRFLYLLLKCNLERIAASAHGFKDSFVHVRRDELTSVQVNVPPMEEQERILQAADSQDHLIEVESRKLRQLRLLRAGLMDDLLSGRVRTGS
jgi:type I restriction enzyme, S subunit